MKFDLEAYFKGARGTVLGPSSAAALPESGGVVTFANARFAIEPGARFGVALTVIRAEDGLASPVAFFDVIRK